MVVRLRVERGPHAGLERREVTRRANVIFSALGLGEAELSILLTDDAHIQALNRDYRSKDRPTDVLAFAMHEGELGEVGRGLLGDVIVSVETARRQAARAKHDVLAEVTMLLAHGVLHLLGWDHETAAKDKRMRAESHRLVTLASARVPEKISRISGKKGSSRTIAARSRSRRAR